MADPRIIKLANLLVHYSLGVKPGAQLAIVTNSQAEELLLEVYAEAIRAGANVFINLQEPQAAEVFYKFASPAQLEYVSPIDRLIYGQFDAFLHIIAEQNTRSLSGVDPLRQARRAKARRPLNKIFSERAASGELRWTLTAFPTHASAQEAEMSLGDYRDFVFTSGKLDLDDPVAAWMKDGQRMRQLQTWLAGKEQLQLKGADIDLKLSIKDRTFIVCDGKENFPDGEIFTGPVEESAAGWVRFHYPAIYGGREVIDVELWFEDGRVVKEQASKGGELLTALLNTDSGSRYLGELGIGTNYDIPRFVKDMLFDEKLGGTVHLAVGDGYPESGSHNESGIHWDMLCDMHDGEITVDGELFYKDGRPVAWSG
jgi:aminopeptidase